MIRLKSRSYNSKGTAFSWRRVDPDGFEETLQLLITWQVWPPSHLPKEADKPAQDPCLCPDVLTS